MAKMQRRLTILTLKAVIDAFAAAILTGDLEAARTFAPTISEENLTDLTAGLK